MALSDFTWNQLIEPKGEGAWVIDHVSDSGSRQTVRDIVERIEGITDDAEAIRVIQNLTFQAGRLPKRRSFETKPVLSEKLRISLQVLLNERLRKVGLI